MFTASLIKWTLVLILFVALPVGLIRLMVYKTIESRNQRPR